MQPKQKIDAASIQREFPRISAEAARVLENNPYWLPRKADVRVEAIAFDEPAFLAGPFDGKFGLVFVEHTPSAGPIEEQLVAMRAEMMGSVTTTYMPASARQTLAKVFPQGTLFLWDPVDRVSYGELDYPELSEEIKGRLERSEDKRCQVFAKTEGGKAKLLGYLTAAEQEAFSQAKRQATSQVAEEMVLTCPCAERPFRVRLEGNDDSSWTVSVASEAQVEGLLEKLRNVGYEAVSQFMHFTN